MTNDTQTNDVNQNVSIVPDLGDPNLSFSDFQALRRGETKLASESSTKSAPSAKSPTEHKEPTESDPVETEEDESSDELDELEVDKPKKKSGFQRRIDKLNAKHADAQREVEYWKAQALKSAGEPKPEPKEDTKAQSDASGEPNPDDFETHAEYVKSMTKWMLSEDKKAAQIEAEKSKIQSEYEKAIKAHHERETAFIAKTSDYKEVVQKFFESKPKISAALEQLVVQSDVGPQIVYALAKDVKEFERINFLSPLLAAREIGKIESKIASEASVEEKPESKKITTAPKPLATVGGSKGVVQKTIDDPGISFADYERIRREQMKRKR